MDIKLSDRSQSEFNPYRCGACGRTEQLKHCSSCRLISFCTTKCQKMFWNQHKEFCRVIGKILATEKKNSIFKIKEEELKDLTGAKKFMKAVTGLTRLLPQLLGRSLAFEEHLLIWSAKHCEVCYETDIRKLMRCAGCKYASFCNEGDCKETSKNNPEIHSKLCPEYKLALLVHRESDFETVFDTKKLPTKNFTEFYKEHQANMNLFTLIEQLSGKKFNKSPSTRLEMDSFTTVCQFTFTATLLNALDGAKLLQPDRESLNIHIVGAKQEETYFTVDSCSLFYIFMPKLHSLKITLIGPEITLPSYTIECFGRIVKLTTKKMFYENFHDNASKPDFIMCFNCGFSEEPWGVPFEIPGFMTQHILMPHMQHPDTSWVRGLRKILSHKVPFAFTSYTKSELEDEMVFMRRVAEHVGVYDQLTGVQLGRNAFKDLRPMQNCDKTAEEKLFYGNCQMCVMNWKHILRDEFSYFKHTFERAMAKGF
uniref:CSON012931 protein n=1 Tax=Culicoides sonorensis TaxID=179676 RepID=A0A336M9H3_CULSO